MGLSSLPSDHSAAMNVELGQLKWKADDKDTLGKGTIKISQKANFNGEDHKVEVYMSSKEFLDIWKNDKNLTSIQKEIGQMINLSIALKDPDEVEVEGNNLSYTAKDGPVNEQLSEKIAAKSNKILNPEGTKYDASRQDEKSLYFQGNLRNEQEIIAKALGLALPPRKASAPAAEQAEVKSPAAPPRSETPVAKKPELESDMKLEDLEDEPPAKQKSPAPTSRERTLSSSELTPPQSEAQSSQSSYIGGQAQQSHIGGEAQQEAKTEDQPVSRPVSYATVAPSPTPLNATTTKLPDVGQILTRGNTSESNASPPPSTSKKTEPLSPLPQRFGEGLGAPRLQGPPLGAITGRVPSPGQKGQPVSPQPLGRNFSEERKNFGNLDKNPPLKQPSTGSGVVPLPKVDTGSPRAQQTPATGSGVSLPKVNTGSPQTPSTPPKSSNESLSKFPQSAHAQLKPTQQPPREVSTSAPPSPSGSPNASPNVNRKPEGATQPASNNQTINDENAEDLDDPRNWDDPTYYERVGRDDDSEKTPKRTATPSPTPQREEPASQSQANSQSAPSFLNPGDRPVDGPKANPEGAPAAQPRTTSAAMVQSTTTKEETAKNPQTPTPAASAPHKPVHLQQPELSQDPKVNDRMSDDMLKLLEGKGGKVEEHPIPDYSRVPSTGYGKGNKGSVQKKPATANVSTTEKKAPTKAKEETTTTPKQTFLKRGTGTEGKYQAPPPGSPSPTSRSASSTTSSSTAESTKESSRAAFAGDKRSAYEVKHQATQLLARLKNYNDHITTHHKLNDVLLAKKDDKRELIEKELKRMEKDPRLADAAKNLSGFKDAEAQFHKHKTKSDPISPESRPGSASSSRPSSPTGSPRPTSPAVPPKKKPTA